MEKTLISVIGGANVDLSATLQDTFIAADSNPGHIDVGYGGVARNIAHYLTLFGTRAQLLTVFGGDLFGGLLYDYCKQIGIDLHLSERESSLRSGLYLCINNRGGEMIAGVADTDAIMTITLSGSPNALEKSTPPIMWWWMPMCPKNRSGGSWRT